MLREVPLACTARLGALRLGRLRGPVLSLLRHAGELGEEGLEASDGPKPLAPSHYFARLSQRLINALTAPTAEGRLYEIDMRLRPSGQAGPIATSLAGLPPT